MELELAFWLALFILMLAVSGAGLVMLCWTATREVLNYFRSRRAAATGTQGPGWLEQVRPTGDLETDRQFGAMAGELLDDGLYEVAEALGWFE